jgi:transcriptional regulator with XRE-family HTH domain
MATPPKVDNRRSARPTNQAPPAGRRREAPLSGPRRASRADPASNRPHQSRGVPSLAPSEALAVPDDAVPPIKQARLDMHLTMGQVATLSGVSKPLISLAENGRRKAPRKLVLFYAARADLDRARRLEAEQTEWYAVHRQPRRPKADGPQFTFRRALPVGMTVAEAKEACEAAVVALARRAS